MISPRSPRECVELLRDEYVALVIDDGYAPSDAVVRLSNDHGLTLSRVRWAVGL